MKLIINMSKEKIVKLIAIIALLALASVVLEESDVATITQGFILTDEVILEP